MPHPSQESRHDQPFLVTSVHIHCPVLATSSYNHCYVLSTLPKLTLTLPPVPHPRSVMSRSSINTYHRVHMSPQTISRHFVMTSSSNTTPQIEVFYFLSRPSICPVLAYSCHSLRYVLTPSKLICFQN